MLSCRRLQGSSVIASSIEPEPDSESLAAETSTPKRLGKYQLIRRLARGGMGDVHLAMLPGELGFEKLLVVKTIRSELAADPRFVELFASEAKTAVQLSHPNITPIYELGRAEDGSLYTAMGWVDGPSLAQWIERRRDDRGRGFELGAALLITRELLDGLAHAHSCDHGRAPVVHRDITPRNVLIDRSGRVQIVDFGIAKPVDAAEVRGVMGSVGYMAPEQARGEPVDPRADVFSVGCVLFELLTLERAFPREGIWMRPDLDALPVALRGLLERALAIDPADRFADAREFFRRLAPVQAELAPSYATPDLAAALREQFATRGWTEADVRAQPGATGSTHVTPVHRTLAFATRVTFDDDAGESEEPSEEIAVAVARPPVRERRRVHPMIWAMGGAAVAVIGGVLALGWIDRDSDSAEPPSKPRAEPAVERAPEPAKAPARESSPTPAPSPTPTRTLAITVTPAQAELWLDGERVAGPPYQLARTSSTRSLELRAAGHRTRAIAIDPSGPDLLHVELDPLGEGQLTVLAPSVAWAEVWLDGEQLGSTPLTDQPVIEGRHKLEVRCAAEVCEDERVLTRKTIHVRASRRIKVTASGE
jgi:hypothetical protein